MASALRGAVLEFQDARLFCAISMLRKLDVSVSSLPFMLGRWYMIPLRAGWTRNLAKVVRCKSKQSVHARVPHNGIEGSE